MPDPNDVFVAIADPKRRQIIELLADRKEPLPLTAISERFSVTRQAVRKHIGILHDAGLVHFEKKGRERYCRVNVQPLQAVYQWIAVYEQFWKEKLDALDSYLDEKEEY